VDGQYFRYGSLRWQQVAVDSTGITVRFRLSTAWRRDYFAAVGGCTDCTGEATSPHCPDDAESCDAPVAGDGVHLYDPDRAPPVAMTFSFGANPDDYLTGQKGADTVPICELTPSRCMPGRVVDAFENTTTTPLAEEDALHIVYVVSEFTYKYPRATSSYTAGFQGCCRMGSADTELRNNAGGSWYLRTVVSLTREGATMDSGTPMSPFFKHIPTVNVIKGRPLRFNVHAFDAASRPITYSLGSNDDQGVGLNPNAQPPFGNVMSATINSVTGQLLFPASAATSYEQFYNLVVIATVYGPCTSFDPRTPSQCLAPSGQSQVLTTTAVVDFLVHVIYAGFTGLPPQTSCSNGDSGIPRGSRVCNSMPVLTVPLSAQRFICGESNSFSVKLQDGIGLDRSVSGGAFAIRHRQRVVLETTYPTDAIGLPRFPLTEEECCIQSFAGINATTSLPNEATGAFKWHPPCERLETNHLYRYMGRHRLDVFGACFVGVDAGGWTSWGGKLTSPPGCVAIHLLRCTKPTISLLSTSNPPSNASTATYTIAVATNLTFFLNASDDAQTRALVISNTAEPGIPSVGAIWHDQECTSIPDPHLIVCNPVARALTFNAELVHAGTVIPLCFEAVNDQVECPRFRRNTGPQGAAVHYGEGVTVSQASEPLCVFLDVPGPRIKWIAPTPEEGETVITYMGCPLEMQFAAVDLENYFDLRIRPDEALFGLPVGATLEPDVCGFKKGAPPPERVANGIGRCPFVTRTLHWVPSRVQSGLDAKVCVDAATMGDQLERRCFFFHVGKCRYCAQVGETLHSLADSFGTDWLQLWSANPQLEDPGKLSLYHLLNIGSLYPARYGDTIASLSRRFLTSVQAIKEANPDLQAEGAEVQEGKLVCVLPGMCNVAEYGPRPTH